MELWRKILETHLKNLSDLELARFMTDNIDCRECPFRIGCMREIGMCDDNWLKNMHMYVEEMESDGQKD